MDSSQLSFSLEFDSMSLTLDELERHLKVCADKIHDAVDALERLERKTLEVEEEAEEKASAALSTPPMLSFTTNARTIPPGG